MGSDETLLCAKCGGRRTAGSAPSAGRWRENTTRGTCMWIGSVLHAEMRRLRSGGRTVHVRVVGPLGHEAAGSSGRPNSDQDAMTRPGIEPLDAGRDAIDRHAWREAFDLLTEADTSWLLEPQDLESLGEALVDGPAGGLHRRTTARLLRLRGIRE